jgi:hypothetical protein
MNSLERSNRTSRTDGVQEGYATQRWWELANFGVLGLWIALAGVTLSHHEKWADEAQAWLLARDLDLPTLWFKELRYEGSPGLWHTILWVAQHWFHAPYSTIGPIGMVFAAAGVAFMFWYAPFPHLLRYLLAFSYFIVYQYAVIARPYTLLPLLAFVAAYLYPDQKHPERMTIVLALLALLSVHGVIMAAGIGLAYLWEAVKSWKSLDRNIRWRYAACVGAMLLLCAFLFVILNPTPDVETFVAKSDPAKYNVTEQPILSKIEAIVSGGLMDYLTPSVIFLLLAGAWCFTRKKLLAFAIPSVMLIVLYAEVHGFAHHHGTLFVAVITGLWIAWPSAQEQQGFTLRQRRTTHGMIALLFCLLSVNVFDAAASMVNDYRYPYCGAEDAANYLKSVGAIGKPIYGYTYGEVAVQAYFDANIFANIPTAYYHHGLPFYGISIEKGDLTGPTAPSYIVIRALYPNLEYGKLNAELNSVGYTLVHFSDGYVFFKQAVYEHQAYFIYQRVVE